LICIVVIGGRMGEARISGIVREMQKQIEIKEMRLEKNPPLWKQHSFADRANFRNIGSNFCRNHLRRVRANLWSGQRKRQGVE